MEKGEKISVKTKLEIAVESGLQLIPYVGGPIATAYFGVKQAKEFQRIERFYKELNEEISRIKDYISSMENQYEDGLISLIEQVNDKVEKEHQERKFQSFKKFMRNILVNPVSNTNYDKRKVFLDTIDNMSLLECKILASMYENKGMYVEVKSISISGINQYAIVGAINKLKSYGFLKSFRNSFSIGGGDNSLNENIEINEYGQEFVEFTL